MLLPAPVWTAPVWTPWASAVQQLVAAGQEEPPPMDRRPLPPAPELACVQTPRLSSPSLSSHHNR